MPKEKIIIEPSYAALSTNRKAFIANQPAFTAFSPDNKLGLEVADVETGVDQLILTIVSRNLQEIISIQPRNNNGQFMAKPRISETSPFRYDIGLKRDTSSVDNMTLLIETKKYQPEVRDLEEVDTRDTYLAERQGHLNEVRDLHEVDTRDTYLAERQDRLNTRDSQFRKERALSTLKKYPELFIIATYHGITKWTQLTKLLILEPLDANTPQELKLKHVFIKFAIPEITEAVFVLNDLGTARLNEVHFPTLPIPPSADRDQITSGHELSLSKLIVKSHSSYIFTQIIKNAEEAIGYEFGLAPVHAEQVILESWFGFAHWFYSGFILNTKRVVKDYPTWLKKDVLAFMSTHTATA